MKNIRLFAFDLDGTLTQHKTPLSAENRAVLERLAKKSALCMVGAGMCRRIFEQMGHFPIDIIGNYGMQTAIYNSTLKDIEIIEDNNAVVEAEITVYDYGSAIKKANEYLNSHPDEFKKEDKKTAKEEDTVTTNEKSDETDNITATDYDEDKFMEYKISEMEKVTDTVKYTIEFTLTKVNGEWQLDQLSNSDIEKLHGIYTS